MYIYIYNIACTFVIFPWTFLKKVSTIFGILTDDVTIPCKFTSQNRIYDETYDRLQIHLLKDNIYL